MVHKIELVSGFGWNGDIGVVGLNRIKLDRGR